MGDAFHGEECTRNEYTKVSFLSFDVRVGGVVYISELMCGKGFAVFVCAQVQTLPMALKLGVDGRIVSPALFLSEMLLSCWPLSPYRGLDFLILFFLFFFFLLLLFLSFACPDMFRRHTPKKVLRDTFKFKSLRKVREGYR